MPIDEWAGEKKALKSTDPKVFVRAASSLLRQREPALTELVRGSDKRLLAVVLDGKAKLEHRLGALEVLGRLGGDPARLTPLLATEKTPQLLQAVAIALGGPDGTVTSEPAVTKLCARFAKPGDWAPQYDALVALRYFGGDPRVEATLRAALAHPQVAVVRVAIEGLGHQRCAAAIPALIPYLGSRHGQHVAAAARALASIALPAARAPLAEPRRYKHALALAKDLVEGRFAARALAYFSTPTVDDDLVRLAAVDDGEVAAAACDGLVLRGATTMLAPLAEKLFAKRDASYHGRFFLVALDQLAAATPKPPAAVIAALAKVLGAVKREALEALLDDSVQLRFQLDRLDATARANVATWRTALGGKLAAPAHAALVQRMLTSPSDE